MKVYGLVGKTLAHSFSSGFFADLFEREVIEAQYKNFELHSIEQINELFEKELSGLNVTVPYKSAIIPFLDDLDPVAREIGAVNTIVFQGEKKIGYNTDAFGFQQAIKPFLTNQHERALLFGTGGAAKAVAYVLREIGIDVNYMTRNPGANNKQFSYSALNSQMLNACKLLVNCTPVGTFPKVNDCLPISLDGIGKDHLVIDLIYNPKQTIFLQKSLEKGATIMNGESMLKAQAMKSWALWNS
jgi:shikimate dehydrogenase